MRPKEAKQQDQTARVKLAVLCVRLRELCNAAFADGDGDACVAAADIERLLEERYAEG